jgi:hypothetical protein
MGIMISGKPGSVTLTHHPIYSSNQYKSRNTAGREEEKNSKLGWKKLLEPTRWIRISSARA